MGALLFVSTGDNRPWGGDRERVASLIATFATATTSVSFSDFTELWSSALDDSVNLKQAIRYRDFSGATVSIAAFLARRFPGSSMCHD
jgi:hypothetical protein